MDRCILWISVDEAPYTLQRGVAGGAVEIADGHHDVIMDGEAGYQSVSAQHSAQGASLSGLMLDRLGFRRGAQLLKNERADKVAFTFRMLMRYLLIDEERIFSRESVIVRKGDQPTAEDKSLLKFLATGVDGSAVVTVSKSEVQKAARDAKIDVLRELMLEQTEQIDASYSDEELASILETAERTRDYAEAAAVMHQEEIDTARSTLSESRKEHRGNEANIADLRAMRLRFEELRNTFVSDIERLAGLEEGGFLLQKFAAMNCPLCGANPEHQHHDHRLDLVKQQQRAAEAEIRKIEVELNELDAALEELSADIAEGYQRSQLLQKKMEDEAATLRNLIADERIIRPRFLEAVEVLRVLRDDQERREEVGRLEARVVALKEQKIPSRPKATDFDPSITTDEAHSIAKVVKEVLVAWGYPGIETVSFDLSTQDLIVDGKERRNNGKGVRAILHSAFQVAILIYCHEKGRPHPKFLILDSPLLAYREPTPDYEKSEDDEALAQTGLAERFYMHLASISNIGQFIVIENATPPSTLPADVNQIRYDRGEGLFPSLAE